MRKIYTPAEHNPPHSYGDCFRACIASLLETDAPHVLHDNCSAERQRQRIDVWLAPRGLAFIEFPIAAKGVGTALHVADVLTKYSGVHYMLSGQSRHDRGHYVVCRGGEVVHNPTPAIKVTKPFPDGYFWMGIIADRL